MSAVHCATLGIAYNAPKKEIKNAYHKLSLQHHPDKNPNDKEGACERFQKINEAYDCFLKARREARRERKKKEKA